MHVSAPGVPDECVVHVLRAVCMPFICKHATCMCRACVMCHVPCPSRARTRAPLVSLASVPVLCHFHIFALPANVRQHCGGAAFGCRAVVVR